MIRKAEGIYRDCRGGFRRSILRLFFRVAIIIESQLSIVARIADLAKSNRFPFVCMYGRNYR